ncbi:transcription factor hes-1 [Plakobranchus ocellatus]|uniref:Transcription factor hes-1 n=1 Tax=Plakobranchus ocellatus TaxID=259542 RepID=A0AAV4ANF0_9GAST|nr:transcription factor hes-1 [Plakobranchus ocellatus]
MTHSLSLSPGTVYHQSPQWSGHRDSCCCDSFNPDSLPKTRCEATSRFVPTLRQTVALPSHKFNQCIRLSFGCANLSVAPSGMCRARFATLRLASCWSAIGPRHAFGKPRSAHESGGLNSYVFSYVNQALKWISINNVSRVPRVAQAASKLSGAMESHGKTPPLSVHQDTGDLLL